MLPLFIVIPVSAALLLAAIGRQRRTAADALALISTLALSALAVYQLPSLSGRTVTVYGIGGWAAPLGMSLAVDGLSTFFLITINILAFLTAMYSVSYLKDSANKTRYYFFFLALIAGLNGVLLSTDLFGVFVFTELASIAAYILTAFERKPESYEAAFKYAVLGSIASLLILFSAALIYAKASSLNFAAAAQALPAAGQPGFLTLVSVLLIAGFGLKMALVPFHAWAPDAYTAAPSPVSAMFAGAVGKTLGIYLALRYFFNIIGPSRDVLSVIAFLGTVSIVAGVTLALYQWDMKRLLAYHSISQIGYIMLGIGLGTPIGILGGLFHLINHTAFKSLLFLNAGSVEKSAGTVNLKELGGLSRKMPVTAFTSMTASLSISGVPPFNGFWSKLIIIIACVASGSYWYALFAVLASILTLASFMKLQRYAFYGFLKDTLKEVKESPAFMTVPMLLMAASCVFMGILLLPGYDSPFLGSALDVLARGKEALASISGIMVMK